MPSLVDHSNAMVRSLKGSSACEMLYPMYVIPAKEFLKLPRLMSHHELLRRGVLKKWSPKSRNKVIVVSHQWLKYSEPDPDNEHFLTLKTLLMRLMNAEVAKVDDWWLHKAVFQTKATAVGKNEWLEVDVWIDYSCMPQVGGSPDRRTILNAAKAVESIPAYVEQSDLLVVVSPVCKHKDSGEVCNYASWRGRGWCRMELMCSILARRKIRTMVTIGENAKPFLLHPCEACRLVTGTGHFSCCKLGHKFNGMTLQCDKEKVRSVLDLMLTNKVEHSRSTGAVTEQHFYASLRHAFLQDLPLSSTTPRPETVANASIRESALAEEAKAAAAGDALQQLQARLCWTGADDASARSTGFTLVMCAALMDDAEAIKLLAAPVGGRKREVNIGLRKNFPHLSYMMKGATPLVGAMVFGCWETCEALIDAGADPKKTMFNGMDALFSACCKGNLPNIREWLKRFPAWEIDRTEPCMGLNATCLSALVGSAEVKNVLQTLLEARAAVTSPKFWGGEESMLCLLASNENVNSDAAHFLLGQGCKVNGLWRPQKLPLSAILKAARLAGKFKHGTAVDEFAVLERATPLHFAAKRGDVELIDLLMSAGAAPTRNKQGHTPMDVAKTFFGGSVPELLRASLAGESSSQPAASRDGTSLPTLLGGIEHKDVKASQRKEVHAGSSAAEQEWRVTV